MICRGHFLWNILLFFLSWFSFTDTDNSQDSRRREGPSFIPLYHFHPLTKIQTFICNFAHEITITYFLIAMLVFTRLLLAETYHLFKLLFDWWCNVHFRLFGCWLIRFCHSFFTWEIGGPELASTIILVLQTNRITKCASHWVRILLYKTNKLIALEMKNSVMQKPYRISQTHLFQHIHDKNFQGYSEW